MDKTQIQNIEQHVKILGWLHIAMNALVVLIAAVVFVILMVVGVASGDPDAAVILPIVAISIAGFLFVLSAIGILTGWGLLKQKSWARILAIVIGFLNLLNFPLGTLMGVYTIWVLLQDGASDYFAKYNMA
ncbi:MAG: hypothetical protein DWQ04_09610 [Chloroflexi bacterium]|nr:MAG: hypothetical protein DWQ04_09610 [Chloroflexota bacterium]